MKFALGLTVHHPIPDEFCEGPFLSQLGRRAEAAGFEAVYFTEHPMPGDDWLHSGGHDALDPFVALAYVAASTTTIKLFTNLTVLPYRNPFLLAKSVATLDRASGGPGHPRRGYRVSRNRVRGVGRDVRGAQRTLRRIARARARRVERPSVAATSTRFHAPGNTALPTPIQDPLPIWLGGNAKITLRRVAAKAQGWMPLINPRALGARRRSRHLETLEDLQGYLAELHDECARIGRTDPIDIAYMVLAGGSPLGDAFDTAAHLDGLHANASVGVNWNILTIGGGSARAALRRGRPLRRARHRVVSRLAVVLGRDRRRSVPVNASSSGRHTKRSACSVSAPRLTDAETGRDKTIDGCIPIAAASTVATGDATSRSARSTARSVSICTRRAPRGVCGERDRGGERRRRRGRAAGDRAVVEHDDERAVDRPRGSWVSW